MASRVISFWGKGGVGKTTLAAALALGLSEEGYEVLALSTDPLPSLARVLGLESGTRGIRKVSSRLSVYELSSDEVIKAWKEVFGEEVYYVISSFVPIDRSVIDYVASAPGIPEQFTLYVVHELWRSGSYDFIVWDTPAVGGGVRLLKLEREFYEHLVQASRFYLKIMSFLESLRRGRGNPLELIARWKRLAEDILATLSSDHHELYLVTLPSKLSSYVTLRTLEELASLGLKPQGLVVNTIISVSTCPTCTPWVKACSEQEEVVKELSRAANEHGASLCLVPLLEQGVQRTEDLLSLYRELRDCGIPVGAPHG